jgi:hypothetical protein
VFARLSYFSREAIEILYKISMPCGRAEKLSIIPENDLAGKNFL